MLISFDREPYDGRLTDDTPLKTVVMSEAWWTLVRGAFERFSLDKAWEADSDTLLATSQALDALARMMGTEVYSMMGYRDFLGFNFYDLTDVSSPGIVWVNNASNKDNGYWTVSPGVLNDPIFHVRLNLLAGGYKINHYAVKGPGSGKFRWYVDNVANDSAQDLDMYAAAAGYNAVIEKELTIPSDGLHSLMLVNVGKNASATGYNLNFNAFSLRQFSA